MPEASIHLLDPLMDELKVCVIVPTYNNARTIEQVLKGLLIQTSHIIVINDGSTDNTSSVLQPFKRIVTISYPRNQGKGYALRQGLEKARELGYDYAISIDSDGQHFAEDIKKFIDVLQSHRNAIIIGSRDMDQLHIPGKSTFGNKFSNFWFWVNTGIRRSDTQSGYRLYPLKPLASLSFVTKKYEFEIEVLVRAAWKGVEVIEVPVKVFYPEKSERISHFRPFKDFTRISILNTVLVTIALLYIRPRDLFQSLKKKNSHRSSANYLRIPRNQRALKPGR